MHLCACMGCSICMCEYGWPQIQQRMTNDWSGAQVVVSHPRWVLRTKLESSGKMVSLLLADVCLQTLQNILDANSWAFKFQCILLFIILIMTDCFPSENLIGKLEEDSSLCVLWIEIEKKCHLWAPTMTITYYYLYKCS